MILKQTIKERNVKAIFPLGHYEQKIYGIKDQPIL
jgi:hypothetical protein